MRKGLKILGYVVSFGCLALVGIIALALFNQYQKQRNYDNWPKTRAEVVGFEFRQVRQGNRLPAIPENKPVFSYKVEGRTHSAEGDVSSATRIGQKRKIAYDPSNPLRIQVAASAGIRNPIEWVLIVSVLIVISAAILLKLRKARARSSLSSSSSAR